MQTQSCCGWKVREWGSAKCGDLPPEKLSRLSQIARGMENLMGVSNASLDEQA
jgi:hypothetical protein